MNPASVKMFLALLWLLAGGALLVQGLWSGDFILLRFGRWQVPLAAPFLIMAAINFVALVGVASRRKTRTVTAWTAAAAG